MTEMLSLRYLSLFTIGVIALAAVISRVIFSQLFRSRLDPTFAPQTGYGIKEVEMRRDGELQHGFDIIFIHGLGSNPDTSWSAKNGSGFAQSEDRVVNWVTDFLPQDIPEDIRECTRLFFYNYNSYWKRDAVSNRLSRMSGELILNIRNQISTTKGAEPRDLAFVAFSYGGLVVKKAIVDAFLQDNDLVDRVKWLIFLGCPHRGSSTALMGKWIASFTSLLFLGSDPAIIGSLQYDSLELQDLHESFYDMTVRKNIRLTNFYELLPQRLFSLPISICVTEQSATFPGQSEKIGLNADHSGLNKFKSRDDSYKQVRDAIFRGLVHSRTPVLPAPTQRYLVPLKTVQSFVERPLLKNELAQKLRKPQDKSGLPHSITITGHGGSGKSQLLLGILETHKHLYDPTIWIDAESVTTIRSGFERCSKALGLSHELLEAGDRPLHDTVVVQAVLHWLRSRNSSDAEWLIVFDNVDEIASDPSFKFSSIIPDGAKGTVIITSRDRRVDSLFKKRGENVHVDSMSETEAVALLLQRIKDSTAIYGDEIQTSTREIALQLENMPLAVDIAGAEISVRVEYGATPILAVYSYLKDLRRHRGELFRQSLEYNELSPYNRSVWTVWDSSLRSIEERFGPRPLQLLAFLSFFRREYIQDDMFRLASEGLPKLTTGLPNLMPQHLAWLTNEILSLTETGEWDDFYFREALHPLLRFNLIRSIEHNVVNMHSLIHWRASMGRRDNIEGPFYLIFVAATALQSSYEEDKRLQVAQQLAAHIPPISTIFSLANGLEESIRLETLGLIGSILPDFRLDEAEIILVETVRMSEEVLGASHFDTLKRKLSLARTYTKQGRLNEAENLEVQATEVMGEVLGKKHPITLEGLSNLAATYVRQRQWAKAENLQIQVVKNMKEVLGEKHHFTLAATANLVPTYLNQGRLHDAEVLGLQLMKTMEEVLGRKHADTLANMDNLAIAYEHQEKLSEMEMLLKEMIEISEEKLGKDHRFTIEKMIQLMSTYQYLEQWDEAETLSMQVIEITEELTGENNPSVLKHKSNLASTYWNQGRWSEARALGMQVTEKMKEIIGEQDPATLAAVENLAIMNCTQGPSMQTREVRNSGQGNKQST